MTLLAADQPMPPLSPAELKLWLVGTLLAVAALLALWSLSWRAAAAWYRRRHTRPLGGAPGASDLRLSLFRTGNLTMVVLEREKKPGRWRRVREECVVDDVDVPFEAALNAAKRKLIEGHRAAETRLARRQREWDQERQRWQEQRQRRNSRRAEAQAFFDSLPNPKR